MLPHRAAISKVETPWDICRSSFLPSKYACTRARVAVSIADHEANKMSFPRTHKHINQRIFAGKERHAPDSVSARTAPVGSPGACQSNWPREVAVVRCQKKKKLIRPALPGAVNSQTQFRYNDLLMVLFKGRLHKAVGVPSRSSPVSRRRPMRHRRDESGVRRK